MEAIFNFSITHLDEAFVKKIKSLFSENAKVEFKVFDNVNDETQYLLSNNENKEMLFRSIEEFKSSKLIQKELEDLSK